MRDTTRYLRLTILDESSIALQFKQVGSPEDFYQLIDSFKETFTDRHWDESGWWVIPKNRIAKLRAFCQFHQLTIEPK